MATTQSGFPVITDYGDPALVSNPPIPGTDARVLGGLRAGAPCIVLLYVAERWNREVEPVIQSQGVWGFTPKKITGGDGSTWSNHAGGVAIDINSAIHSQGAATMSEETKNKVRKIISDVNSMAGETVIDWGGEWSGGSKDEMHVQLHGNVDTFALSRAAAAISGGTTPTPDPGTGPETPTDEDDNMPTPEDVAKAFLKQPIAYQTAKQNPNGSGYVPKRVAPPDPDATVAGLLESTATLTSRLFLDDHPAKDN